MKIVVITGSTKGIGQGMAASFLEKGCQVVVSGRKQDDVEHTLNQLAERCDRNKIFGQACDVTEFDQVQALWDNAVARFGRVDIWISNAGQGQAIQDFWTLEPDLIRSVVNTNLLGQMHGAKVAITGMVRQGGGAFYIMEGKGARGDVQRGFTLYGTTKRAGNFLFHSLVEELKGTPVMVGSLSPGMVVTGLLTRQKEADPENWERTKKIFNILASSIEEVSPWLVEKVLANDRHGVQIKYLSGAKVLLRFLKAPFSKRDLFADD
jgi:NAD(P)-dependent dehydrogenase (short-subunit alcohol dehydrogenase family)